MPGALRQRRGGPAASALGRGGGLPPSMAPSTWSFRGKRPFAGRRIAARDRSASEIIAWIGGTSRRRRRLPFGRVQSYKPRRFSPWGGTMAGHSQFKNIMHKKGAADARRSKLFSSSRAKSRSRRSSATPDPAMNARLRLAIHNARAENMPEGQHRARRSRRRSAATARTTRRSATRATAPAASP